MWFIKLGKYALKVYNILYYDTNMYSETQRTSKKIGIIKIFELKILT